MEIKCLVGDQFSFPLLALKSHFQSNLLEIGSVFSSSLIPDEKGLLTKDLFG